MSCFSQVGKVMKLLDLFCGAGGAAMGYHHAGFEVVGVDIKSQKNYPFKFMQGDAMHMIGNAMAVADYDLIHVSPPCQGYSVTRHTHSKEYPDLLPSLRQQLQHAGVPWVIENVVGAPMPDAVTFCGASFGLSAWDETSGQELWLKRHRLFETSFPLTPPLCNCKGKKIGGVYGGGASNRNPKSNRVGYTPPISVRRELMGIDWMSGQSLNQAVPPAYTEYIGKAFIAQKAAAA